MKRAPRALAAGMLFTLAACVSPAPAVGPALSKSDARLVKYLESPDRSRWQKPEEVVRALRLVQGQTVTDLGAGSGYFSRRLAAAVGPQGVVDAADVDAELLEHLRSSLDSRQAANVVPRHVAADEPGLSPASADLVFVCNTYHQLPDRVSYLRKLAPGLKPDGRVAIVDFHKREDIVEGPPFAEKVDRETVLGEFLEAGFEVDREEEFLPYQYFVVFRRARGHSFDPLARSISEVMRSGAPDRQKQRQVAALLSRYLQGHGLEAMFQRPNPALPVTTYLLHSDPDGRFSIAALVFQPHGRTTIHDHQSWVVWGTYTGQERETRYRRTETPGEAFPRLTVEWSRVFGAGDVSFIDPPPGDVHDVENVGDSVSVSLHVHATDIAKQARNSYDVKRRIVKSFVQTYEPAM
jgi:predicted metal-dependent enzyme (double-stranded beta helix superfamily)/ubiquinone/menaquinone biosynthesis C-methylase UbiE